jgi:hypothetical protein
MALGGIDLNLLVILQALIEEGNLTRAGMRVGMPQPAMSTALARLRRHYKDELLVLGPPLLRRVREPAPSVRLQLRLATRTRGATTAGCWGMTCWSRPPGSGPTASRR